jgi:hypothetical protein
VAGLEPIPPGLVPITEWRPDPSVPADGSPGHTVPVHGVVARKP